VPLAALSPRLQAVALLGVFSISRLLYALAGIGFDTSPLDTFWQFPDRQLLLTDLARTLWYFHAQPPLFIGAVGAVLRVAGDSAEFVLHLAFAGLGAAGLLLTWWLLCRLGVSRSIAWWLAAIYAMTPTAALYESWLFYPWPTAVLLLAATGASLRYLETTSRSWALALFALIAAIALVRAAFPLAWVAIVTWAVIALRPAKWRLTLAAAAIPLVLVGAVSIKNAWLFSSFGTSSWGWLNACRVVHAGLPPAEREALVVEGQLPSLARIGPFSSVEQHLELLPPPAPFGHPALDAARKSSGATNFNHSIYLEAATWRRREWLDTLRERPRAWVAGVLRGLVLYTLPATEPYHLRPRRERVARADDLARVVVYGQLPPSWLDAALGPPAGAGWRGLLREVGWFVVVAHGLVLVTVMRIVRRSRQLRRAGGGWYVSPQDGATLFAAALVIWVAALTPLVECGENFRFRVMVEPLLLVTAASALVRQPPPARTRAG
jgi:hypothetical protein